MNALADYYAKRAPEYERIYQKPERRADLRTLRDFIAKTFAGRDVLEVACGTGWWTDAIASAARSIVATDINDAVLAIAETKALNHDTVSFRRCDAFHLDGLKGEFNAGFAAFWWSHLNQIALQRFLRAFHLRLKPGSFVVFIDNIYVAGSSTPISRRDDEGNTYQMRKLDDGSATEVLKNFPTDSEITAALTEHGDNISIERLTYYWRVRYTGTPGFPLSPQRGEGGVRGD